MKKDESQFLTHKQRVKFIGTIMPFITVFIIPAVIYSASNKLPVICFSILSPIVGLTFLKLSVHKGTGNELLFKILPVVINGIFCFLTCLFSGPDSPSFLIGIPLIGACTLIFSDIRHLIIAVTYGLTSIILGSYLAEKTMSDLITYTVFLLCYSAILIRILQFTIMQGNEIISSQKKIEIQKRLIEDKQKEILDSIRYAKRIQISLLPTDKYIDKVLNEHGQKIEQKENKKGKSTGV